MYGSSVNLAGKTAYYMLGKCIVLVFVDKLEGLRVDNSDDAATLGSFVSLSVAILDRPSWVENPRGAAADEQALCSL